MGKQKDLIEQIAQDLESCFQDVVELARKTFWDSVPSPRPECPPYREALDLFPGEDWGERGDLVLVEEVLVEDEDRTYCIWSGCFWDPDQRNDRFVGIWINERTPMGPEGLPGGDLADPAAPWEAWIGWNYRWNEKQDPAFDDPSCVGFVEE